MKKLLLIPVLIFTLAACNQQQSAEGEEGHKSGNGKLEFAEDSYDFGEIKEGEVVSHTFKFKNVGTDPVEILSVNVSCGCTVASKPEKPVGVGQEDEIVINFNSKGKAGINRKTVSVVSNAQNEMVPLTFTAVVNQEAETEEE